MKKEALKAQAVVARTYTIYKIENKKHDNADICDSSTCCQAWVSKETRLERWEESKREENWNKIEQCVNETKGKIVTYDGKPINAFFFFMLIVVEQQNFRLMFGEEVVCLIYRLFKQMVKKVTHNIILKSY